MVAPPEDSRYGSRQGSKVRLVNQQTEGAAQLSQTRPATSSRQPSASSRPSSSPEGRQSSKLSLALSPQPEARAQSSDDSEAVEQLQPEHDWNFCYNRRLECSSHAVSCLRFTPDGRSLVVGMSSGEVKVWETTHWGKDGKPHSGVKEALRTVAISPSQRWLVCVYPSALHVFQSHAPWRLELSLPAVAHQEAKAPRAPPQWACAAFSPTIEVNHSQGRTGQNNYLAALGTGHLRVLDYSGGWGQDMIHRVCSIMHDASPTSLVFTECGLWLVCGFSSGQLQIWNAHSLSLHKTLNAHTGAVNYLHATPLQAAYQTRVLSCSTDQTLRLWDSFGGGWVLEQHLLDDSADRLGVHQCVFSSSGTWALSVTAALKLWRVCFRGKFLELRLHQRFDATRYVEDPCCVAFCCKTDAIAMGLRDGTLCVWMKHCGAPPEALERAGSLAMPKAAKGVADTSSAPIYSLPQMGRPMHRVMPHGMKLPGIKKEAPQQNESVVPHSLTTRASLPSFDGLSRPDPPDSPIHRRELRSSSLASPGMQPSPAKPLKRVCSVPEGPIRLSAPSVFVLGPAGRSAESARGCVGVDAGVGCSTCAGGGLPNRGGGSHRSGKCSAEDAEAASHLRRDIARASCVKRISLEPQSIAH